MQPYEFKFKRFNVLRVFLHYKTETLPKHLKIYSTAIYLFIFIEVLN